MTFSLVSKSKRAIALGMLCLLQSTQPTVAATTSITGKVVVPMSSEEGASKIEISFEERNNNVIVFTIQSFGLSSSDVAFFKVEGPLDCVRPVSTDGAIVSATVMGTAMNAHNFFNVGETLVFAVADNSGGSPDQVSIISRATTGDNAFAVCDSQTWDEFQFINVVEGDLSIEDSSS